MDVLKTLAKQPYWVIALVLGVLLVAGPSVTIDKDFHWSTHPPTTFWLVGVGIALLLLSALVFTYTLLSQRPTTATAIGGLDLSRVEGKDGELYTRVGGCEIRVINGRIEDYVCNQGTVVVLPCNEYFDDQCIDDTKSALGAFANRMFEAQIAEFAALIGEECRKRLTPAVEQQKTQDERGQSFGPGRCVLLTSPLGRATAIALVSTTTQRASEGLVARISYLFNGMRELVTQLADARFNEVAMPVLGAGHGRIDPPLALVGLLLALAEAARHGQGGQRLRKATVVVFQRDVSAPAEVAPVVVRRALALIASRD